MDMTEYENLLREESGFAGVKAFVDIHDYTGKLITIFDFKKVMTKYRLSYILVIAKDRALGTYTTTSITKQMDAMIGRGVDLEKIKGCTFLVENRHLEPAPEKGIPDARDFLKLKLMKDPHHTPKAKG